MILKQLTEYMTFTNGTCNFKFLPTGDIFEFTSNGNMINAFQGNPVEGSANNIYLRTYVGGKVAEFVPLLGVKSSSNLQKCADKLIYTGQALGVKYTVIFAMSDDGLWFWNVGFSKTDRVIDVVYAQDIGVAGQGGVLTNELYMSQYLDHSVLEGDNGYTVCSRQNQCQGELFPYLQQGALGMKLVGYSTDATQFFGLSYKETNIPVALYGNLENRNYQFELSYTALQTEKIDLGKDGANFSFYGLFKNNHKLAVTELEFQSEIATAYAKVDWNFLASTSVSCCLIKSEWGVPYSSPAMDTKEIDEIFPDKISKEYDADGNLMSFFTKENIHIVLKQKEVKMERPHGHIITTLLDKKEICDGLITATNYMYGIFNGQVVAGNTSFHKFLSTPRGMLNILKNTGQRIYVKINNQYRILTMPALYEIGINYAQWYYKIADDMLIVTSYAVADVSDIVLKVASKSGRKYSFVVTNQLVLGECEFQFPVNFHQNGNVLSFTPPKKEWETSPYPELNYNIILEDEATVSDDRIFYNDNQPRNGTLLTIKTNEVKSFQLVMQGRTQKRKGLKAEINYCFDEQKRKYIDFYQDLNCGFNLTIDSDLQHELDRLNLVAVWYSHNAMTHFAVPHGLEQPGGAAWGTRDVCQGPMEYFLATRHYVIARKVICTIFEHQFLQTKEWPQWFMFDKYPVQAGDCHGDIVFWPLKCIGDYVKITGDYGILQQPVSYFNIKDNSKTVQADTILKHIKLAVSAIEERFLHDTALISYAGGDWDDTLQPAKKELADYLVSAWTMALAYQSIGGLVDIIATVDKQFADKLKKMADDIKASFEKYLIKDGVIAGFAYCEDMSAIRYMLHPDDNQTRINYRLLPLTRSIIGEMVDIDQSKINVLMINTHLKCPDGVRLMDRPARYNGGVSKFFQRAEQAANVGREISLQYVHAHIRYIEAMAKLGNANEAWEGLLQINPINIQETVKNARLRQSNAYFSSSEGAFDNRYEYQNNFDMLRSGTVEVKGGWRIYSSGPGIYMNQLISNVLGIRFTENSMIIDPTLPQKLDGLRFRFNCFGKQNTFVFHIGGNNNGVSAVVVNGKAVEFALTISPYRKGGAEITNANLLPLIENENTIEIYVN